MFMIHTILILIASEIMTGQAAVGTSTLEVHDKGVLRVLDEKAETEIRSLALRLLGTSNFNSERHRDIMKATPQGTHARYRRAVAGRYVLVSFEKARRIKTVGGEVEVVEVVIGLNRPEFAESLFTIDGEGRVVAHGKHSGVVAVGLAGKVKEMLPEG